MSVRVSNYVWRHSKQKGAALLLLLAIADQADDDGRNAWPSVATLAKKIRMTSRSVQLLTERLVAGGELRVEEGGGKHGTHRYSVVLDEEYDAPRRPGRPGKTPGGQGEVAGKGVKSFHPPTVQPAGVKSFHLKDAQEGGEKFAGGVKETGAGGEIAISPDPSLTRPNDPSINRPAVIAPNSPKGRDDARAALLAALGTDERAQTPWAEACRHPPKLGALWARAALVPPAHALGSPALVWADAADRDAALLARLATSQARDRLRRAYPDLVTVHLLALADLGNDDNGGDETHGKVARDDVQDDAAGAAAGDRRGPGRDDGAAAP